MLINKLLIVSLVFVEVITAHDSYGSILAEQLNQYCALHVVGAISVSNRSAAHRRTIGKSGPRGPPGVAGPPGAVDRQGLIGPAGPQGLSGVKGSPGVVDYDKIDEMIIAKIQKTKSELHSSCTTVKQSDAILWNSTGGIFDIYPGKSGRKLPVYCDTTTDDGGWMVFQRRMDGSVNFTRNWNDYVNGFGNLEGEFWMGLEKIHRLTSVEDVELRFDLEDWEGNTAYAVYSTFSIGDASTKYQLSIGGYSGTAGNGMPSNYNNMMFSTYDEDNDTGRNNCALDHMGGWWFFSCNSAFLNGLYLHGSYSAKDDHGIGWHTWKSGLYSLKSTEMKFRPKL